MILPQVAVVEDDRDLLQFLKELLVENGYWVKTAGSGATALKILDSAEPNIVILDLVLPDMTGESLCQQIRKKYPTLPIIMLTAKDAVEDKVSGLSLGADDYLTKPFAGEELIARIRARLRQSNEVSQMSVADLTLNVKTHEVKRGSKTITLTPQEFKLLEYLMRNTGVVLTREMILNRVWLYSPDVQTRVVDVYMGYLRKKIDTHFSKKLITSVRGFGYTLKE